MNIKLKMPIFCTGVRLSVDSPYRHSECDHCKRHFVAKIGEAPACFLAPDFVGEKCPLRMQK